MSGLANQAVIVSEKKKNHKSTPYADTHLQVIDETAASPQKQLEIVEKTDGKQSSRSQ